MQAEVTRLEGERRAERGREGTRAYDVRGGRAGTMGQVRGGKDISKFYLNAIRKPKILEGV